MDQEVVVSYSCYLFSNMLNFSVDKTTAGIVCSFLYFLIKLSVSRDVDTSTYDYKQAAGLSYSGLHVAHHDTLKDWC